MCCTLKREGSRHSIFKNDTKPELISAVPRHSPIKINTIRKICRELDIPNPRSH
ncbi:MAG: type II toxin-antitoxin system HicA family toxin [Fimbriimonadaceae bacterium]